MYNIERTIDLAYEVMLNHIHHIQSLELGQL